MNYFGKIKSYIYNLSIKNRLAYSNILMFFIPAIVTAFTAVGALAIGFLLFTHYYLPGIGLTVKELHDVGEQYEDKLKMYALLIGILLMLMLLLMAVSIFITNRFLVGFMLKRVEEPLGLLNEGVSRISDGELDYTVKYDRNDEFLPVCEAFNRMAQHLKSDAEQAAAAEQSRRELFAGISHDLRSPLTSIRAYTEAMLDGIAKTPEDNQRYLKKIQKHEIEIEHLVDALFLYTKMELRDYPVHLKEFDLKLELERICDENFTDNLNVKIDVPSSCTVFGDTFLFERTVLNLLDNSRKYRKGEVATVNITAFETPKGVTVSFADDGIGVPDELLPKLFEPFYRTDPARKKPSNGSGLGLAIVREAVRHMNGKVWAENVPDGGLNVKVLLMESEQNDKDSDN